MRVLVVLGLSALAACATSTRANNCDPNATNCALDAMPQSDATIADAAPDGPPKKGFGEPCTDSMQCQSDICILVSSGGVCSQECGMCPDGYGCFGVLGAIDPNQVSYVCVPVTSQLCSVCQQDSECAQIGMDKCLTEATGRKYCARDCSHVSCPTGYDCTDESINGSILHECVPHSGACDCNAAAQGGATDPCTITTALATTCAGTSTCGGLAGWSACQPPSATDSPDATYTDNNCDGIDGDLAKGIFVAGGGANTSTCGLTFNTPCQTISFGIVRAVQAGKQNVYVQAGTYNEVIVLLNGVDVWGGYDFNWQRGPATNVANRVTVIGKQDTGVGGDGEWLTVRAHDLIVPVTLGDLILQGPNAQGTGGLSGRDGLASYVVHAKGAGVTLTRVQLVAGNGAPGGTGPAGTDAVLVDAQGFMAGGIGGAGVQKTACDDSSRGAAGTAGTNSCSLSPSTRAMNGGAGGAGGTMDTDCGIFSLDLNARSGDNGSDAALLLGSFGLHGAGGSGGNSCGPTTPGNPGVVANGSAGTANSGGYLGGANGIYWYARSGNPGATGDNGTGGGGGGGGGGCDNGTDGWGAGGSGGGAGGCAARAGGGGGGGGGGSFGIFATASSTITLDTCQLFRGTAGNGGDGGTGGRGQSGGSGGPANANHPNTATPGNGGAGAHGGHGGGGAGGQGGRSIGILSTAGSTITGSCMQSQGAVGNGGNGGVSAPTAPVSERDGNGGAAGSSSVVEDTRQCVSPTSC